MKVATQQELNDALADSRVSVIDIVSPRGVWLEVRGDTSRKTVTACDSSTVTAYNSSTVTACDSSTVTAYDSSTVRAYNSSTVTAYNSSTVTAYDSSTVRAYDSSTVRAYNSSTVTAYDSSTVTAYDSSTVTACDSSTVRAYDSSTVTAYNSSTVRAYNSSTVTATPYVAVHLHSARVSVEGGVVIDITAIDRSQWEGWMHYHGVEVIDGEAILYKAVDQNLKSGRGFVYPIGEYVEDPQWRPGDFCGNGLHLSPLPIQATAYFPDAKRWLKVAAKLEDISIIAGNSTDTPKVKVKGCRVLAEVTIDAIEVDA